ncbi:uncharacterized protein LOC101855371 [Aplysia californica]|uniref:Uncharacterized protein LOC101855371 n=1 Tax=Aplysia californica TaxID=6500 RepID=A0ABM0K3V6_APLCA|nr:uncharacterized protein LOC101855371 [Aplysia californica]
MDIIKRVDKHRIVAVLRELPCLWDERSEDFKNTKLKDNARQKILLVLSIPDARDTAVALSRQISHWKSYYRKELTEVEKNPGYKPRWSLYNDLDQFLRPVFLERVRASLQVRADRMKEASPSPAGLAQEQAACDEWTTLGNHVAATLKSFDRKRATNAADEISDVLNKYSRYWNL